MESREKEPQPPFYFKDQYREYQMPQELKLLCDQLGKKHSLNRYLYLLSHVSGSQQAERQGTENVHFTPILREGQDAVSASTYIEEISKGYEGSGGMENFIEERDENIKLCGEDIILELERYFGVDSQGIEAGDLRPLLGVNNDIVKAVAHYIHRENGYQEIK